MSIDVEKYLHHFDGYDMTEQEKLDHIQSMANILQTFVDQAWDREAGQIAMGKTRKNDREACPDGLNSDQSSTSPFNDAAQ